jgi:hypothetical protein
MFRPDLSGQRLYQDDRVDTDQLRAGRRVLQREPVRTPRRSIGAWLQRKLLR